MTDSLAKTVAANIRTLLTLLHTTTTFDQTIPKVSTHEVCDLAAGLFVPSEVI